MSLTDSYDNDNKDDIYNHDINDDNNDNTGFVNVFTNNPDVIISNRIIIN